MLKVQSLQPKHTYTHRITFRFMEFVTLSIIFSLEKFILNVTLTWWTWCGHGAIPVFIVAVQPVLISPFLRAPSHVTLLSRRHFRTLFSPLFEYLALRCWHYYWSLHWMCSGCCWCCCCYCCCWVLSSIRWDSRRSCYLNRDRDHNSCTDSTWYLIPRALNVRLCIVSSKRRKRSYLA